MRIKYSFAPGISERRIHAQQVYLEGDPRKAGEWGSETEKRKADIGALMSGSLLWATSIHSSWEPQGSLPARVCSSFLKVAPPEGHGAGIFMYNFHLSLMAPPKVTNSCTSTCHIWAKLDPVASKNLQVQNHRSFCGKPVVNIGMVSVKGLWAEH